MKLKKLLLTIVMISGLIGCASSTVQLQKPDRIKPIACMGGCECLSYVESGEPRHVLEVIVNNLECHKTCEAKRQCLAEWIKAEQEPE